MNANEFDLDFDFEKEYGFDPPKEQEAPQSDADFDLKAILESEFGEEGDPFNAEYTADFDYGPESEDLPLDEDPEPIPAPEFELEPVAEEIPLEEPPMFEFEQPSDEAPEETPIPEEQPVRRQRRQRPERRPAAEEPVGADGKRRKPMSPMRRFKNEQLPKIILGVFSDDDGNDGHRQPRHLHPPAKQRQSGGCQQRGQDQGADGVGAGSGCAAGCSGAGHRL